MKLETEPVDLGRRIILERLVQLLHYELRMWPGPDGLIDWGESLDDFFGNPKSIALFLVLKGEQLKKAGSTEAISPGDSVIHAAWGPGEVKEVSGSGRDAMAKVEFEEPVGTRWVARRDEIVGFALLHLDLTLSGPDGTTDIPGGKLVDAYYVTPHWRRRGIGRSAAHLIFDRYPGLWKITTWPDEARVAFWHHVVTRYPRGTTQGFRAGEYKGNPGQFVWIVDSSGNGAGPSTTPAKQRGG